MVSRYLAIIYDRFRAAVREWGGEAEYERYLRHCARHHEPALARGRFFARRLEERYSRPERCC